MATGAPEKGYPQLLLEAAYLVAQRRLGDVETCGGAPKVELLRDGDEVLDEPEVEPFHRRSLLMVVGHVFDAGARRINTRPEKGAFDGRAAHA